MDFEWAEAYPDIKRLCVLFGREELQQVKRVRYTPLRGYMQVGPQCGLVALMMARGDPCPLTVQWLFQLARSRGYTVLGELFSAEYMRHLAELYITRDVRLHRGRLDTDEIRRFLLAGGIMLVPYDTDKANQPAQLKGHNAHWAVISGGIETEDSFFVVARHGKARNIAIWPLADLADSNAQLEELSMKRKRALVQYKVPEGGLGGPKGLKMMAVLIYEPPPS